MIANTVQEEARLDALQRIWRSKRMSSALFKEDEKFEDLFSSVAQTAVPAKGRCTSPLPVVKACSEDINDELLETVYETSLQDVLAEDRAEKSYQILNGATLGDLPAHYKIYGLKSHQQPVVGVYIDRRVCPGFKYRVQPLSGMYDGSRSFPYLFEGKALTLRSIGRGYARRFTFEANKNCLNNNGNYFWSDSRPEGFAFELELVSDGDKFTVFDVNDEAQGTLEILKIKGAQVEISNDATKNGIEKKAKINFIGKVEFYETRVAKPIPISGVVVSVKEKGRPDAQVVKIINVNFRHHRYYLIPGIQTINRRVTVRGEDIRDVPTKYTMTGLESYEMPVVGTYVDPRIIPGFYYKVRINDRRYHLFQGRALKLCSIGMGYAKRLTFEPDSLVSPDNHLWSDNHPDGLGLEPRAVHTGTKFSVTADGQICGEATVFRADAPQAEEKMEMVMTSSGKKAIVKYIHIDVTCHVKLDIMGGRSDNREEHLMRVYGLAIVRKEPNSSTAHIIRVENVGLDSQLNVLFARTRKEITFIPL